MSLKGKSPLCLSPTRGKANGELTEHNPSSNKCVLWVFYFTGLTSLKLPLCFVKPPLTSRLARLQSSFSVMTVCCFTAVIVQIYDNSCATLQNYLPRQVNPFWALKSCFSHNKWKIPVMRWDKRSCFSTQRLLFLSVIYSALFKYSCRKFTDSCKQCRSQGFFLVRRS